MNRIVIVIEGGLVRDVLVDSALDVEVIVADFDAAQYGESDDEGVSSLDGDDVWIAGQSITRDPDYVERVFALA